MAFLELTDTSLWYEDTGGAGDPVVLLHPFTGNADVWEPQVTAFSEAGFRCVAYDRRGWGRSVDRRTHAEPTFASRDLDAMVEALNITQFHLMATGGGGYVALDYAVSRPQRLRSLVVSCSGGPLQGDPEYGAVGRMYGRPPEFQSLPPWFKELGPSYRVADPAGVDRWLAIEQASQKDGSVPEAMENSFTLGTLELIPTPTLMIAGGADLYAPPPRMRLMADRIPDCAFEVLGDAGHAAHWEQPVAWNRLALAFMRQHQSGRP